MEQEPLLVLLQVEELKGIFFFKKKQQTQKKTPYLCLLFSYYVCYFLIYYVCYFLIYFFFFFLFSIIMAMKAYRDRGRAMGIKNPEIIASVSAHPAFDKVCLFVCLFLFVFFFVCFLFYSCFIYYVLFLVKKTGCWLFWNEIG